VFEKFVKTSSEFFLFLTPRAEQLNCFYGQQSVPKLQPLFYEIGLSLKKLLAQVVKTKEAMH